MNIEGNYKFKIFKDGDWYIAKGDIPGCQKGAMITQGRSKEEIFEMIADCYMAIYDVRVPLWNKILWKLMIFRKDKK